MSTNIKLITSELHKAFHFLNGAFYNNKLPEPSILIQSKGNRKNVLGWCTVNKVWTDYSTNEKRYEITLVAEYLNKGMLAIICTLLHEMAHLYNLVNNIQDVSRSGTYHNKKFKQTAENGGLIIEHDKRLGWSLSKLQPRTINLIKNSDIKEEAFTIYKSNFEEKEKDDEDDKEDEPKKKKMKYICNSCETIIVSDKELNVLCQDCNEVFELFEK